MNSRIINWTIGMDTLLRDLWHSTSNETIATRLGVSRKSVEKRALIIGLPLNKDNKGWRQEDDAELRRMWRDHTISELMTWFGASRAAVKAAAARLELSTKRAGAPPTAELDLHLPPPPTQIARVERGQGNLLQSEAEWRRKCIESNQQFEAAYRFWCARTNYIVQEYRA